MEVKYFQRKATIIEVAFTDRLSASVWGVRLKVVSVWDKKNL